MSNPLNIGVNVDLGNVIAEMKSGYESFKQNKSYKKEDYDALLNKYSDSIRIIEQLKQKIEDLQKNKLPTKDEVESISAMLDVLNKLDAKTINRINKLGKNGK